MRLFHRHFFMLYVFVVWNFTGLIAKIKIFWVVGGGGSTQLQCIYYLVPYTDLYAAEGVSAFQTSLLSVMLLTNTDQENRTIDPRSNGLKITSSKIFQIVSCLTSHLTWQFHENLFIRFFFRNVANRHRIPQRIPVFRGLHGASKKCSRMFLVPCRAYPANFMKIHSRVCMWVAVISWIRNVHLIKINQHCNMHF